MANKSNLNKSLNIKNTTKLLPIQAYKCLLKVVYIYLDKKTKF